MTPANRLLRLVNARDASVLHKVCPKPRTRYRDIT